jgi:GxxExxY protein
MISALKHDFDMGGNSRGDAVARWDNIDVLTGIIIEEALSIHRELGPGLLESVYEAVLQKALLQRGLKVERQKRVPFEYAGIAFDEGFRVDLMVEDRVVLELKSVERFAPVHSKQLLTYLRLLKQPVGLLINFGCATLKEGLKRVVNNLPPETSDLQVNLRDSAAPRETSDGSGGNNQ